MTTAFRRVRPPAVAGSFYPGDAQTLAAEVDRMLAAALGARAGRPAPPRALVVPHAGYVYSGPVAATAYATVAGADVGRVVVFGPAHRVPLRGLAVPSAAVCATPLGPVEVAEDARATLVERGLAAVDDDAHALEHSLEVQLPFLQRVLPGAPVLPVAVGAADARLVEAAIDAVWDEHTLVVVSSDLSHYESYAAAREHDAATAATIVRADADSIATRDACGAFALRGLLRAVRPRGLVVRALDLRSSGDTSGPRDQVVGYGAFSVGPTEPFAAAERDALVACALVPVAAALAGDTPRLPDVSELPARLREPGAAFVTLERGGELLGCIGTLRAEESLGTAVARYALAAAFADPRLPAISVVDYREMSVKVSVLSPLAPLAVASIGELVAELRPGHDGLLVEAPSGGATFLPAVWASLPSAEEFLGALWQKAGWHPGSWPPGLRAHRYGTVEVVDRGARLLG